MQEDGSRMYSADSEGELRMWSTGRFECTRILRMTDVSSAAYNCLVFGVVC